MLHFLEFSLGLDNSGTERRPEPCSLWLITAPAPGPPGPCRGRWPCWQLPRLSQASKAQSSRPVPAALSSETLALSSRLLKVLCFVWLRSYH